MTEEPQITIENRPPKEKRELPAGLIAGAVFMAVALIGLFFVIRQQSQPAPPPAPSAEAEAYLPNLSMAELGLSAEENFLGQQSTYVDGALGNQGDRTVRNLTLRLYFRDTLNQVILQQDRPIIQPAAPLAPGDTRQFRLHFDSIPNSWNQQVPQFQLVAMEFEEQAD